jgi:UDP-N-acetylmuramoyl-L-alanine---L-glutamate ligase
MRLADLAGQRVAVWGYGREGRAALAALRQRLSGQQLTLLCSAAEAAQISADAHLAILADGTDAATLAHFDVVIKSPGISPYHAPVPAAERAGVRFTSGSALWFAEHAEARTICVTGTKGKSTVAALIAHILRKSGKCVALAGNIGLPLLELLEPERKPDWWVIELSSFQTRDFGGAPTVAVITNLYEEHLDWHGSRERYVTDKLAIAAQAQALVVNAAQPELVKMTSAHSHLTTFGMADGWHVAGDAVCRASERVLALSGLPLPGAHNAQNVCAALAAIEAAGMDARALASGACSFKPLPHRLQSLGKRDGIQYINDSIATTPYATIEALRSLDAGATVVLVGGFDRGLDWSAFVAHVAQHPPRAIVTMGANGTAIADALRDGKGFELRSVHTLGDALACARTLTPASGTILLSPGAPSFDQFHNYAERGREFARLAGFDPAAIAQIEGLGIA